MMDTGGHHLEKGVKTGGFGQHGGHRRGHDPAYRLPIIKACGNDLVAQVTVGDNADYLLIVIRIMDEKRANAILGHGPGRILDSCRGGDLARHGLDNIADLHGKEIHLLIPAPGHTMATQLGIGGSNDLFRKTLQVKLGKTGLFVDQVQKDLTREEETKGVFHHFNIKICLSTANNR